MNTVLYKALVLNEWRLRSRRASSLVILLGVVAVSWLMVLDPRSGMAMMVTGKQRIAYESPALAFATTLIASILFGLAGFYLARGRSQEDLRTGTAGVLAATPVTAAQWLGARWLGAFLFLLSLGGTVMLTAWVLQLVRGEGALQPWPYLQMLMLGLAPGLMFCASLAVLADAWAPLMGKRGDLLYWLLWMAQFAFLPATLGQGAHSLSGWQVLDIGGLSPLLVAVSRLMDVNSLSVGGAPFDPALPVLHMPEGLWSRELVALRLGAMLLALLPLVPAVLKFHRYAPDLVKAGGGERRGRLARGLQWLLQPALRPLRWALGGLLRGAARLPGLPGRWLADIVLVLLSQPVLTLAMVTGAIADAFAPVAALPGVLAATLAAWGVAVADISSRDAQAGVSGLAGALPGGHAERGWRQAMAAFGLGVVLAAPALLRLLGDAPLRVAACGAGLLFLSAAAALVGRLTQGPRTFMASFLFALYLELNRTGVAALDLLGLAGDARPGTAVAYAMAGLVGLVLLRWHRA